MLNNAKNKWRDLRPSIYNWKIELFIYFLPYRQEQLQSYCLCCKVS